MPRAGVIAIQGDFEKHLTALSKLGAYTLEVRTPEDLAKVDRVIIPGGESTTVGRLMDRFGLGSALIERAHQGMPIWGTCMGMIILAKEVEDYDQFRLGLLDITVRRNAFGAQVHSFEDEVSIPALGEPLTAVFIRAPVVTRCGEGVEVLASYRDEIVAVRQGSVLGTAFHPELTDDTRLHEWFLSWQLP
ncbi:MAG: Pyridoxal 5'-phosphate synthase subunit PdxT [Fimbriimonadaceae bacterium]|nr:Pyridoxal 5'-phosphate synthase subunit PdxT [Fimbriimonadaceae bacterium]